MICKRCDGVLKDPLHCKMCKGYYCTACLQTQANIPETCEHPEAERVEVTKYLKTKIGELQLCCKYKKHGCSFTSKLSAIDIHEKTCAHTSYACTSDSCTHSSPMETLTTHLNECDFRLVVCPKGCHKKMKVSDLPTHDCLQWLLTLTATQHDRNRHLFSEYDETRLSFEALKDEFEKYRSETDTEIKEYQAELKEQMAKRKAQQEELQGRIRSQQEMYDNSYTRFREHTHQRLTTFTSRAEKDLEDFFRQTTEGLKTHTARARQTLLDYTVKTKADAASFSLSSPKKTRSPAKGFSPSKSLNSSLSFSMGSRNAI